jgi:hypothetical protein
MTADPIRRTPCERRLKAAYWARLFAGVSRTLEGKPVARRLSLRALGHEQLLEVRVVDDAQGHPLVDLQGDGDREEGQAVGVVGGTVEGIDDPAAARASVLGAPLLGQDGVVGKGGAEGVHDERLRARVHLGDEIGGGALVGDAAGASELATEEAAGGLRGVDRHATLER